MKKIFTVAIAATTAAVTMCGCGKSVADNSKSTVQLPQSSQSQAQSQTDQTEKNDNDRKKIQIYVDGEEIDGFYGEIYKKAPISGVRRRFAPDRSGKYTVEYVHAPYGKDKDETLDYRLTLNDDNTFTLTVVAEGVTADHNGHWYERRGEIMMFYDEAIDDTAHNVYVSDSLYGSILPQNKIMIYDNCYTIVLAKQPIQNAEGSAS